MDQTFIREELARRNFNFSKVARTLGVDYGDLKRQHSTPQYPIVIPTGAVPADYRTLGKEGMQQFVVAVKKVTQEWPARFLNAITAARLAYNSGSHEMCQQTRKDGWVVLYSIPRKAPTKPRDYFYKKGY